MNALKNLVPTVLAATLVAGVAGGALAASQHEGREADNAAALAQSKVTLQQAIAAVEQQTGAKALGADVENENGGLFIAVEFVKDNAPQKALVDLQTGKVVKVMADEQDGEEGEGGEGEHDGDE